MLLASLASMRASLAKISLLALSLAACSLTADQPSGSAVPGDKADDFLSASAYEYILESRTSVTIEAELANEPEEVKLARVKELIGYKQIAIGWFLTQFFIDKEHDAPNAEYGGLGGLAKGGAFEDFDVKAIDDVTYEFTFRQIVAGGRNLMSELNLKDLADGKRGFDLEIGRPSNEELAELETNNEWYRDAPWSGWNPSEVDASKKETLTLAMSLEKKSTDAWFDYNSLFDDGRLTIDVHFGWDYHNDYHVKHAEAVFGWLGRKGFEAPVDAFEDLRRDSGSFTKTINANGKDVEVEVRVFYGRSGSETDPDTDEGGIALEEDVRASFADRDAIVYSGHSGPFYGFAMGNWRKTDEGDFDDSEMGSVQMPSERYQIVFAEGCDTYHIGEALRSNPAKPEGAFLDVITTTSFSDASGPDAVQDFIARLIETDSNDQHLPRTMKSLLTDLDSNSYFFQTMYGIHGIDDNPAIHPYAAIENLCEPCGSNDECGGIGNLCIDIGTSGSHCAPACTDDRGCPDDYECTAVADSGRIYANACVPKSFTCQ